MLKHAREAAEHTCAASLAKMAARPSRNSSAAVRLNRLPSQSAAIGAASGCPVSAQVDHLTALCPTGLGSAHATAGPRPLNEPNGSCDQT